MESEIKSFSVKAFLSCLSPKSQEKMQESVKIARFMVKMGAATEEEVAYSLGELYLKLLKNEENI